MIKVGIDALGIYTSRYALPLKTLAKTRGTEVDKYHIGLGQYIMAVPPPGEDIVTMAANAAHKILQHTDKNDIDMLLFATESGIDQSKAAGIYVHDLLKLKPECRVVELKQACYSATIALKLALPYIQANPTKKILLIASDIARYGLGTTGESSQGAGACAMLLSQNPKLIAFEPEYGVYTENVMDFWRPNYLQEALVEGKYSSKLYLAMLEKTWKQYEAWSKRTIKDHAYFCYHVPVPKLVEKAHKHLLKINQAPLGEDIIEKETAYSLAYGKQIGNSYSASLYIALASLLDNCKEDLSNQRIGFYSYGSGCVAEFFSGIVQPNYRKHLQATWHRELISTRTMLDYADYESFYTYAYPQDGSKQYMPEYDTGFYRLKCMEQHKRMYEPCENTAFQLPLAEGMT